MKKQMSMMLTVIKKIRLETLFLAFFMCFSQRGTAQVFVLEDMVDRSPTQNVDVIIPLHGVEFDQTYYTPVGGGAACLIGLASAYLLSRGRKRNKRAKRTLRPMKKHLVFSMLFLMAPVFAAKVAAQAYYVIVPPSATGDNPYMYLNGTTYGATTTFDASTCVWAFDSGILKVGSYYLQGNNNNLSLVTDISDATTFTITGTTISYYSGKTRYVVYDKGFKGSDKTGKEARAIGATQGSHTNEVLPSGAVTTAISMCNDTVNNPTVYTQVGSATVMNLGRYYFKGDMTGTYDGCPGYYEWSFTSPLSATFYVIDGSNQIVSLQPTPANSASLVTAAWSLSTTPLDQDGNPFLYPVPDPSTGELTLTNGSWGTYSPYYGWGCNNNNYHKGAPINVTLSYSASLYGAPVGSPSSITLTIKAPTWKDYIITKPSTFVADADGNYAITCREDLAWLINAVLGDVVGLSPELFSGKTVYLTCDLDMSEYPWVPIGQHHYGFAGTFDGRGYVIKNISCELPCLPGYTSNDHFTKHLGGVRGFFGNFYKNAGTVYVKDLFLQDIRVGWPLSSTETNFAHHSIGGIAGGSPDDFDIRNCGISGYIYGSPDDNVVSIGSIIGYAGGEGTIESCYSVATVEGHKIGGLVGYLGEGGTIVNSFANPIMIAYQPASGSTHSYSGGLVAVLEKGIIKNCYVRLRGYCAPTSVAKHYFGLFVGDMDNKSTVQYNYAQYEAMGQFKLIGDNTSITDYGIYDKTIPYKYFGDHNLVVSVSGSTTYAQTGKPLVDALNDWAIANNKTTWAHTTSNINEDYPLLRFDDFNTVISPRYATGVGPVVASGFGVAMGYTYRAVSGEDGPTDELLDPFMFYKRGLDNAVDWANHATYAPNGAVIDLYFDEDLRGKGSVIVFDDNDVQLYINEDVAILHDFPLKAYVGITLDNSAGSDGANPNAGNVGSGVTDVLDWHMFSTPLAANMAPLGIDYYGENVNNTLYQYNYWNTPPDVLPQYDWLPEGDRTGNGYFPDDTPYGSYDYYCWTEPDYQWINFKRNGISHWHEDEPHNHIDYRAVPTASPNLNEDYLIPGKGYLLSIDKDQFMQSYGTLGHGTVSIAVTRSGEHLTGYNLLGNPYQSYLDFDAFAAANASLWETDGTKYSNSYILLDEDQKGYVTYTATTSPGANTAPRYINMHQGFMILADNAGTAAFADSMRRINQTPDFRGKEQPAYPLVNLRVTDANGNCENLVVEMNRPDCGGARKAKELRISKGLLYAHYEDGDYSIFFAPEGVQQVPIYFETNCDDSFVLTWDTHNGDFQKMRLVDNITGTTVDMSKTDRYVFQSRTTDYKSRFKLVFDVTGVEEDEDDMTGESFAFVDNGLLVVNAEGRMDIVDLNGRVVFSASLSDQQSVFSLDHLAHGVYVVRIAGQKSVVTQKVVLQ